MAYQSIKSCVLMQASWAQHCTGKINPDARERYGQYHYRGEINMHRRRLILAMACLVPCAVHAQSGFVGQWQGEVEGIGKARLYITAVKPSGQVEGRMEFELKSYVSSFGDDFDAARNTNYGMVAGPSLVIESALGGWYHLVLNDNQLSGVYWRGTTFRGVASFTRV